jgi:hypothetical protein
MDPEQNERAADWVADKWRNPLCPVCQQNVWQIGDLVELRPFTGGDLVLGGPLYPMLQVICGNCAHTVLFNAVLAGIVGPETQPEDLPKEDPG